MEKRIIVNGRFLLHRITGVERYAREILSELDKIVQQGELVMAIPPETKDVPEYRNITITKIGHFHNRFWEHLSFPAYVHKKNAVSLNLCNVAPLSSPGIVCIHDVKIKACPKYFSRKFVLWYNILFSNETKKSKRVITVSEFSKKEICKYYKIEPQKVVVVPDAWQHYDRIGYDEKTLKLYGLERDAFYFSMCSLEPNKNFRWIAEVARKNPDCLFAVAGSINHSVFAEGMGFECPANMKLLGYIRDEEAKTLMRDCRAFLFPTYYEGFGIPPLEAMSAGAQCILVSDTEVMHEIFGEAVNYIDPDKYDIDLNNIKVIDDMSRKSILQKYTWESSAKEILRLLRE